MKKRFITLALLFGVMILALASACVGPREVQKSVVPIPPDLVSLPTIKAEPWLQVDTDTDMTLEGPSFDRQGNLYASSVRQGKIFKITPQKQVSVIFENKSIVTNGTASHKDGRLFVACMTGELLSMDTNGKNVKSVIPTYEGKRIAMNDLVFDSKGNLFVTDFTGNVSNPTGGVYHLAAPDYTTVTQVLRNLWTANGVSLSPDGKVLWVGETLRNTVIRAELSPDGITPNPRAGVSFPYYSTGAPGGPDSNRVDAEGNLYQALIFQGRVVVLNDRGIPIANIIVPGRDEGKHLKTANLAIKPGSREAYLCASGEGGAWLYKFEPLANGVKLFSHQ
jgi:lactonase